MQARGPHPLHSGPKCGSAILPNPSGLVDIAARGAAHRANGTRVPPWAACQSTSGSERRAASCHRRMLLVSCRCSREKFGMQWSIEWPEREESIQYSRGRLAGTSDCAANPASWVPSHSPRRLKRWGFVASRKAVAGQVQARRGRLNRQWPAPHQTTSKLAGSDLAALLTRSRRRLPSSVWWFLPEQPMQ